MRGRLYFRIAAVALACTLLTDCAATPESCQIGQSTTTTGALVGAGAGAALGGLAAGLARQNGGAAAGIVVGAALIGAAIGAAVAHAHDEACHQLALQQALDMAAAQNAQLQQQAAAEQAAAQQAAEQKAADEKAAEEAAAEAQKNRKRTKKPAVAENPHTLAQQAVAPEVPATPVYMTVGWADKMTSNSGSITPIADVSDPNAPEKQVCMTFSDTQNVNGQSKTVLGKACRAPNGDWHPV